MSEFFNVKEKEKFQKFEAFSDKLILNKVKKGPK